MLENSVAANATARDAAKQALAAYKGEHPDNDTLIDPRTLPGGSLDEDGVKLAWAAGHGRFVASLIEQVAPDARIVQIGACSPMGFEREDQVAAGIIRALNHHPKPDIINLSWCAYGQQPAGAAESVPGAAGRVLPKLHHEPILLRKAIEKAQSCGVVVVAAAGNSASQDPTYPAAWPGVISVGGLDREGRRSEWSNYGDWVRAWALGVDLRAEYVAGSELPANDPDGHPETWRRGDWAVWSGTSFATALVSGQLAILMSATGVTGAVTADALLRMGYPVAPDAGTGRAIAVHVPGQIL
jgi:subtilisin family serine protease